MKRIILCTDGEKHSQKAEDLSIEFAKKFNVELVCLYVVDAYPKKFTDEIYAINREECRRYLDKALTEEGLKAFEKFMEKAKDFDIKVKTKLRYGLPYEEIMKEIKEGDYDLLIMGLKRYKSLLDRIRSFYLPKKVFENSPIPVLFAVSDE
ncbi:MAG: universal stress protein [Thermodesulfovibrio sp.]